MEEVTDFQYLVDEGLDRFINLDPHDSLGTFDAVSGTLQTAIPPCLSDLARLHRLIRSRKVFTVLEFGVGYSTIVIADALKKNQEDWGNLKTRPEVRNRYLFNLFSVDSSEKWLDVARGRLPEELASVVTFHFSKVKIGTFNGQLCHYYESLPDIVPEFIYLDGPDPKTVEGSINGLSFQCDERTVMAADLLLMESVFLPGTFIILDGRTNNGRFLKNNFKRNFEIKYDETGDITTFELKEERLGKYNILGSDFFN